jgi:hypothetical protein
MAGRGMGAATKGGGCIEKGAKNKMVSKTSTSTDPVFLADGGDVSPRKRMAMGMKKGGSAKKMHKMPDGSMMADSAMKKPKKMKKGGSC